MGVGYAEGMEYRWRSCYPAVKALLPGGDDNEFRPGDPPVLRALAPGLELCYQLDEGTHFRWVTASDLRDGGLTEEALHAGAVENLAALASEHLRVAPYGAVHALLMGGDHEAGLMAVGALWEDTLAHLAPGGALVAVPSRDILAFCDASSARGRGELADVVNRVWPGGDHLITRTLYRRAGGRWVPDDEA